MLPPAERSRRLLRQRPVAPRHTSKRPPPDLHETDSSHVRPLPSTPRDNAPLSLAYGRPNNSVPVVLGGPVLSVLSSLCACRDCNSQTTRRDLAAFSASEVEIPPLRLSHCAPRSPSLYSREPVIYVSSYVSNCLPDCYLVWPPLLPGLLARLYRPRTTSKQHTPYISRLKSLPARTNRFWSCSLETCRPRGPREVPSPWPDLTT